MRTCELEMEQIGKIQDLEIELNESRDDVSKLKAVRFDQVYSSGNQVQQSIEVEEIERERNHFQIELELSQKKTLEQERVNSKQQEKMKKLENEVYLLRR